MTGKPWTPEEVDKLHRLRGVNGLDVPTICRELGRTKDSVRCKIESECILLPRNRKRGVAINLKPDAMDAVRRGFDQGITVRLLSKRTGVSENVIKSTYRALSLELKSEVPQGTYIGAKEMAAIAAPICGVSPNAVMGRLRIRSAVLARMAVTKALRDKGLSYPVIGRALGGRDHSTIINLVRNFPEYVRLYPQLAKAYQAIKDAQEAAAIKLAA